MINGVFELESAVHNHEFNYLIRQTIDHNLPIPGCDTAGRPKGRAVGKLG